MCTIAVWHALETRYEYVSPRQQMSPVVCKHEAGHRVRLLVATIVDDGGVILPAN